MHFPSRQIDKLICPLICIVLIRYLYRYDILLQILKSRFINFRLIMIFVHQRKSFQIRHILMGFDCMIYDIWMLVWLILSSMGPV